MSAESHPAAEPAPTDRPPREQERRHDRERPDRGGRGGRGRHGEPRRHERSGRHRDDEGRGERRDRPPRADEDRPAPPREERPAQSDDHFAFVEEIDERQLDALDIDDVEEFDQIDMDVREKAETETGRSEERTSGKRRRRRRRGGRRSRSEAESPTGETAETEADLSEDAAFDLEPGDSAIDEERLGGDEPAGERQASRDEADRSDERPTRRRRRRGGRRGGSRKTEAKSSDERRVEPIESEDFLSVDEEMAEDRSPTHDEAAHHDDRRSRHESDDVQDDADGDELHEGKAAPSIPTWKEVIGVIIAGNMESRARSPKGSGGGSYRGRGGRGHGRDSGRPRE
jgi:hypothetical protein